MAEHHVNGRLEAFCDGVFAIAITLLVIDLKVPKPEEISSTAALWGALGHLLPAIFAFVLSFGTILITWVNHHAALKLIDKSSTPFVYANGVLLLAVAILPFPTGLLGEYLFTDHAAPAVVLYAGVQALTAVGWILISLSVTNAKPRPLTRSDEGTAILRSNYQKGVGGVVIYLLLAVAALWFPVPVAAVMTLLWIGWVIVGVRIAA